MSLSSPLFGITGWSGCGKTTLITSLLPRLCKNGLTVHTIKHAHAHAAIDHEGTDSHHHREAGAKEVILATSKRWSLIHSYHNEQEEQEEPLSNLLARMSPADLILIEGFKHERHVKMEVYRHANGKDFLYDKIPHVIALALASDDAKPSSFEGSFFSLNDYDAICQFILTHKVAYNAKNECHPAH